MPPATIIWLIVAVPGTAFLPAKPTRAVWPRTAPWNRSAPVVQVLHGEDFAGEEDGFERGKVERLQQSLVADGDHNGRHPKEKADGLLRQKFHQFGGEDAKLVGDNDEGGALGDAEVQFQGVDIEIEGRQTADALAAIQFQPFKAPIRSEEHTSETP